MKTNEPICLKVVLIGTTGVGKKTIAIQFTERKFDLNTSCSISANRSSKIVEFKEMNQSIKFDIYDTRGQEKFRPLAKLFYKDAQAVVFVYNITSQCSFDEIKEYWYKEVKANAEGNPIFAVVANKIDLYMEQRVRDEDGETFADEIGAIFQTTSAKSGSGIDQLFDEIGKTYLSSRLGYKKIEKENKGIKLDVKKTGEKKKKKCA